MSLYETVFIMRQDISAQDADKLADSFAQIIENNGGKVVKREDWGLRNLSYIIEKNRKGHYRMFVLDTPYPALAEMERCMKLNEDLLRHMTIKLDHISDKPSKMLSADSDDPVIDNLVVPVDDDLLEDDIA
jgi:small subunit ribosomal protein S6